jgi:lipopolysaccharide/colanic/teichoic acid biosynthesis glycosyltransferase
MVLLKEEIQANEGCVRRDPVAWPAPLPALPSQMGEGTRGRSPRSNWYEPVKRVADFVLAFLLLTLTAPVVFLAGLVVKLTSRGPVFYSQVRLGRNGRRYILYKIRTMIHNCERLTGPRWATPDDPRVTPVGRFLRCSHLDELPQLWNVLRGEMSLVGPRPERPEIVGHLERAIPHYRDRLLVRPGLSGLSQVHLPPDNDLESVRRKLAHDLFYVRKRNFWLDLRIMLSTALFLIGIPFAVSRRLFRLPSGATVERVYKSWAARPEVEPRLPARPDPVCETWPPKTRPAARKTPTAAPTVKAERPIRSRPLDSRLPVDEPKLDQATTHQENADSAARLSRFS